VGVEPRGDGVNDRLGFLTQMY